MQNFQKLILLTLVLASQSLLADAPKVIYGSDDRKDLYQVKNPLTHVQAAATAAMVDMSYFTWANKEQFKLSVRPSETLGQSMNLCLGQKFREQKNIASCSGFLVAEDVLVTAGHCFAPYEIRNPQNPSQTRIVTTQEICQSNAWIFDYQISKFGEDPTRKIYDQSNLFLCKQVVAVVLNDNVDYAVIKLDRKASGRTPLKFSQSQNINLNTKILTIGNPSGLPTKVTDNARVTANFSKTKFSTNLDTFGGNSGSAVINAQTGVVEGILIAGKPDYRLSNPMDENSCVVVNKCNDQAGQCEEDYPTGSETQYGELVQRMYVVAAAIKKAQAL